MREQVKKEHAEFFDLSDRNPEKHHDYLIEKFGAYQTMDSVEKTEKEIVNCIKALKATGSNNDYLLAEWARKKLEVYQSEKVTLNTCLELANISKKCSSSGSRKALGSKSNTEIAAKYPLHYSSFVHGDPFMLTHSPDRVPLLLPILENAHSYCLE